MNAILFLILFLLIFCLILCESAEQIVCKDDGFFPDPYECAKFYRCHSGRKFEFACSPGTIFNPQHNGCDWPHSVPECQLLTISRHNPNHFKPQQRFGTESNSGNPRQEESVDNSDPYKQNKNINKNQQKYANNDDLDSVNEDKQSPTNRQINQYNRPHRRYKTTTTATTGKQEYDYEENVFEPNSYEDLTNRYTTRTPQEIRYGERQRKTTQAYRIPDAKTRTRSYSSTTTNANIYSEHDSDDQFMELFPNGVEKLPDSLEDKDYLTFEDWIKFSDFETTTSNFELISKKQNPKSLHNNYGNEPTTQINKKYSHYITTTLKPKTSTNRRQRKPFITTTSNPFDEWLKENDGNDKRIYNTKQKFNKNKDENFKFDPLKIPELMAYLNCNETTQSCDKCEELDWIKYNGLTIQLLPYRSYKFKKSNAVKQCFKSCIDTKQCIAYSYSVSTGLCHIYDTININTIEANSDWVLIVENPRTSVLREEWVYTKNGKLTGNELIKLTTNNYISCLKECIKLNEKCRAISFDVSQLVCQLYDEKQAFSINTLKVNAFTVQHISIFNENKDHWRFTEIGQKTLNNSNAIVSIYITQPEQCFYECLEITGPNCWFITIESIDDYNVCHIFGYHSTPKWIQNNQNTNTKNYILNVPKNHANNEEYSGYSYVGNPVEVKQGMTAEECKHYANEKCDYCRKYTSIIETKECALFSDSAMLSPALDTPNQHEISGLISIPKSWEYLAFKRIPWIMLTSEKLVFNPFELKGEINGQKCLKFCFEQKLCLVTAIVYDITDNTMFCYYFNEQHIENANITEYENAELFVKIQNSDDIPIMTNRSTQTVVCSDGKVLEDAIVNMDAFDGDIDMMSKQIPVEMFNKNEDNPLSPHGYDFYGRLIDYQYDDDISINQKSKSSVRHSRDVENISNDFDTIHSQDYNNAKDFVRFVQTYTNNNQLLSNIRTISKDIKKLAKRKRFVQKTSDIQLSKNMGKKCDKNDFTLDDDNDCDIENNNQYVSCNDVPNIIYSDNEAMSSCNGKALESHCDVICKTGYQPNKNKIKCEFKGKNGDNFWDTKHVKCLPKDSDCEEVDQNRVIRIKMKSDYPRQRLHYVLRYDKQKKLPLFASYFHTRDNNDIQVKSSQISGNILNKIPCKLLDKHQISQHNYNLSDYNIKPLLAKNAFLYSKDADIVSSYSVTNVPQDPFTSGGPWSTLENRTLEILKTRPGIVITGVCPNPIINDPINIDSEILDNNNNDNSVNNGNKVEIPECFWKTVCIPLDNEVTAASFYAQNTHPLSQLEKQSRVEQVRQYRGQEFVARLLGSHMFKNIWKDTYDSYKDINPNMKLFVMKCSASRTINSLEAIKFWDRVIKDEKFGSKWPSNFAYGLEKTEHDSHDDNISDTTDNTAEQSQSNSKTYPRSVSGRDQTNQNENKFADITLNRYCNNDDKDNKVIGYITSRANKSFTINEGTLLTHVVFAHIHIDSEGNIADYDNNDALVYNKLYEILAVKTKLIGKNKRLNSLVSIGGWNNSKHFSSVAASPEYRNNLIYDIIQLIDYWNLDGIEIDWKYPVITGANDASVDDKNNLIILLSQLRKSFKAFENARQRTESLLLSITGASAHWIVDKAYDLEKIVSIVDWITIMSFDYFGPWNSKWGSKTGPNAPLFNSSPITALSRMNIHSSLKHYFCSLNDSKKLVMSIPFYGHYWNNVGEPIDSYDDHYREAESNGGLVRYNDIKSKWLSNQQFHQYVHEKSFTPWLWNEVQKILLSYENEVSISEKLRYAIEHKLGGVALWAIDFDTNDNELLNVVTQSYSKRICVDHNDDHDNHEKSKSSYKCNPLKNEKRWWTDKDGSKSGMCGRSAPLINGYYPACDPDQPSFSCCSSWGRCGSGPQYCECKGCVDYGTNPELLIAEPQKPKHQIIRWLTKADSVTDDNDNNQPICGYKAPLLNGSYPICNPDDDYGYCCSTEGFCGIGYSFCNCNDCVNFRANPKFSYHKKLWWDKSDGANKAGRCGKSAPKINTTFPICNPYSEDAHCCSKYGFCGNGPISCECNGCVNFKKNPYFRWK